MPARIYLDHLATTPLDPRVREAMEPWLGERFGHPASGQHPWGWAAEKAIETARARVADLLAARPDEVVFTSGGTEADNLAVKGVAFALQTRGRHLVTTDVEGGPVHDALGWLEARGWSITRVGCDERGRVAPEAVGEALREDTVLVSLPVASAEVGTLQPVAAVGALCAEHGTWLHVDAAVAALTVPLDVEALGAHLLSLSGHRLGGPPGIGALYVRRRRPRVRLEPLLHGGGHERGLRAGMVNVPGAVGFGAAADVAREEREADAARLGGLRDDLETRLGRQIEDVRVLGAGAPRLPHASAVTVAEVEGESLLLALPHVGLATGSSCTRSPGERPRVFAAMGLDESAEATVVRFGLGRPTTPDEIAAVAGALEDAVARLRA